MLCKTSHSQLHTLCSNCLSVTEYLSGTTQNVLVVTSNATMASDLRVFSSDNNSTMKTFANSFIHPTIH